MGQEVREVHKDWKHPTDGRGHLKPLFGPTDVAALRVEWDKDEARWIAGTHADVVKYPEYLGTPFLEWDGARPDPADYMPNWAEAERTHLQMYETVSEGTPISPVMETAEELARWLADDGANAGAGSTASYESWLRVCHGGIAPTFISIGGALVSGVEGLTEPSPPR